MRMKLWITHSAEINFAWNSNGYSGAVSVTANLCLNIPNVCSMTFQACACHKLKSSSWFAGLEVALS